MTVEERGDERAEEKKDHGESQDGVEEEGSKETVESVDDHDLEIYFEANDAETEDGDFEKYYKDVDYDYPEVREEDEDEDPFYDMEGIFDCEDDEDIYYEMEDNEGR